MIRVMADSDDFASLPHNVPIIGTYADLITSQAALDTLRAGHPGQELVFFDRGLGDPLGLATIIDVETGSHSVPDVPGWLDRKTLQGALNLTVYSDREQVNAIDHVLGDRRPYRMVATLDGTLFIGGYQALGQPAIVQFASSQLAGVHADISLVYEDGWHHAAGSVNMAAVASDARACQVAISAAAGDITRLISMLATLR